MPALPIEPEDHFLPGRVGEPGVRLTTLARIPLVVARRELSRSTDLQPFTAEVGKEAIYGAIDGNPS